MYSSNRVASNVERMMLFSFLRELALKELEEKLPVRTPVETAIQPTPRRRTHSFAFPWMFVLVVSLFILVMGPLVWLFVASATYTYPTSSITSSQPAPTTPTPESKVVCSASTPTASAKTSAFSTTAAMVPLATFVSFDGGDPIKDAIEGCARRIPQNLATGSDSGSGQGNGSYTPSTTTIACDAEFTIILTITPGDLSWLNPDTGQWEVVGRNWPSPDTKDFLLWNPEINLTTGQGTGPNLNLYIYKGKVTVTVPGLVVLTASSPSDQSTRVLQDVYAQFGQSYHGILKETTKDDDGPTVLAAMGINGPYNGENEW